MMFLLQSDKKNLTYLKLVPLVLLFAVCVNGQNASLSQDSLRLNRMLNKARQATSKDFSTSISLSKEVIRASELKNFPELKAEANLIICSLYPSGMHYDSIFNHCVRAIDYFKENDKQERLAWTYDNTGIIYDILGNREKALETIEKGLKIFQNNNNEVGMAYCLNDLGVAYSFAGDYVKATDCLFRALKLFEKTEDDLGLVRVYACLGFFYKRQAQAEKAKEYLLKSYELSKKIGHKYWSAKSLSGYLKYLIKENSFEDALAYNEQVFKLSKELNSEYILIDVYRSYANIYFKMKEYSKAESYAFKSLDLMKKQNRFQSEADLHNLLGEIYITTNQMDKAQSYLNKVLQAKKTPGSKKVLNYKLWTRYYKDNNDFEQALFFQSKYSNLKDSLLQKEKMITIANVEKSYELGKKQAKIDLLNKENTIQQKMVKDRNKLLIAIVVLAILLCGLMYRTTVYKKRVNRILEKKISDRTKDLLLVNTRLEKSNEELKRFAYITSHDLREPLRNISGFLQLIERRRGKINEETTSEYIALAKSNAIQMHHLINDVLDFSQLDASLKGTRQVDLNDIIDQVKAMLKDKLKERNVQIDILSLPTLNVLHSDMIRLFHNLIENGIKYNESKAPKIEIECVGNHKEYCIFVKDNGIGIEKEYFEKIFEMFSRLHTRNVYEGSGIGLASCKKIIEKYGGEILIQSKLHSGTTFILTFPK